jgi:hypothetical protein
MIFPFRQVLRLEWCGAVNTGFGPIVALKQRCAFRSLTLAHRRHGQRLAANIDGPKECDVARPSWSRVVGRIGLVAARDRASGDQEI